MCRRRTGFQPVCYKQEAPASGSVVRLVIHSLALRATNSQNLRTPRKACAKLLSEKMFARRAHFKSPFAASGDL